MNRKLKNEELNRLSTDEFKNSDKIPITIVLDNIRSLNNIGSVFRTADAFRVESILLCGITACPPNKEIHKTALGATETVNWKYFEKTIDAINFLKNQNVLIISIEQAENSIELQDFKIEKNKNYALIFGNEVKGVEQEVVNASNFCVEIPQFGTKHSFNISVSVGIVLWDLFLKISLTRP
ncbi:MAG: RNA methyltransferase [Bacteroidetes bacterium GWA2_31_9]|nr:MAG: RNA methyltransferase [Bacteroidetes bacterium GWA2_31_9]